MSGWKATDAQANNKPSYITHIGADQTTTTTYDNNVVLVDASREANASFVVPAHTGWVHLEKGTGPLATILVANVNPLLTYSSDFFTITGSNVGSPTPLVSANAQFVVTGGNNITVQINSIGSGYVVDPTIVSANKSGHANNRTLIITATSGGRSNRVQSEVLVALSTPSSANSVGAQPWFAGV